MNNVPGVKKAGVLLAGIMVSMLATGCRQEMYNQPKHKPLERSQFFDDEMSARPLVAGTVSREAPRVLNAFYTGLKGTNLVEELPMPLTGELLERGRQRFNIYCSVCHGFTGSGNGMIAQRGFPNPPSFHTERLRQAPLGHFFHVITRGYGVMYPYATRVAPEDRWAIAAYIRALQLSRDIPVSQLPADERRKLEGAGL